MTGTTLTRLGDESDTVRDLQRRLRALGHQVDPDVAGIFGPGTRAAVLAFQTARGIDVDGICGPQTWRALSDAGHHLGDRLLYLSQPMLRGDDVEALQTALGALGFDPRWVDGIFGPETERAVIDFQRNAGASCDGIVGPHTLTELRRFGGRTGDPQSVTAIREQEQLRARGPSLSAHRVVLSEIGTAGALADATGRRLLELGVPAIVVHDPDDSATAAIANQYDATVLVGLRLSPEGPCRHRFYEREGFTSVAGARLAAHVCDHVDRVLAPPGGHTEGRRLPLLRETRMPAVEARLGPTSSVIRVTAELAAAIAAAIAEWAETAPDD